MVEASRPDPSRGGAGASEGDPRREPVYTGFVSLGLILIPVSVYRAEVPQGGLQFEMLDSEDGARVRMRRVNERSGREVPWESVVKGFRLEDGRTVTVTGEDFARAAAHVVRGIEILDFVQPEEISPAFYEKPYYVAPGEGGAKAYGLLRDAMREARCVAIARAVLATREHLAALAPHEDGRTLVLLTMRFADELRGPEELPVPEGAWEAPAATAQERELTAELVGQMSSPWEPGRYHDQYRAALRRFIERKAREGLAATSGPGEEGEIGPPPANLAELLQRSVSARAGRGGRAGGARG